jgi:hypothetical protein
MAKKILGITKQVANLRKSGFALVVFDKPSIFGKVDD